MGFLRNLASFLANRGPESRVPLRWLFRRTSSINKRFRRNAKVEILDDGDLCRVLINSETFAWPKEAPIDDLLIIASELSDPEHPHQYLWGNTRIDTGDIVVDVGACEGSFSARAAAAGAQVVSIEPSKAMQRVIRRIFELKNVPIPLIVGCMIGQPARRCFFADNQRNPGSSRAVGARVRDGYEVEVVALDDVVARLNLPRVDFIKCDAEGAEIEILKSAVNTLKSFRPKLAICTYHNDEDFLTIHRLLTPLGYHIQGKGFLNSATKLRVHMLHAW